MIIKKDGPFVRINNILAGQTPKALDLFTELLMTERFDLVIEIGTGRGGFTEFLHAHCKNLISYDITDERRESKKPIDFRLGDCLSESIIEEIKEEISKYQKVLILCDGGLKEEEVKIYSKLIPNSGSYIMCHDYSDNPSLYHNFAIDTSWPTSPESNYKNIKSALEENGFNKSENYYHFASVFWGCFIKQ